jgi:hypothetical protein
VWKFPGKGGELESDILTALLLLVGRLEERESFFFARWPPRVDERMICSAADA